MNRETLKSLKVQSSEEILRALVRNVERDLLSERTLPLVRITMGTHVFSGTPIKIEERHTESWLALYQYEGGLRRTDSVAYLPLKLISTIVIDDADSQLSLILESGKIPIPEDQIPSRLNVERAGSELQSNAQGLGWKTLKIQIDWSGKEIAGDVRYRVAQVLSSMKDTFTTILNDEMGREAAQSVSLVKVVVNDSSDFEVTRSADVIAIKVGQTSNVAAIESELTGMIEKVL
jgi:hypothetical protein